MKPYNGWEGGYCTWAAQLWLTNEQGTAQYCESMVSDCLTEADGDKDAALIALAGRLDDELREGAPDLSWLWGDLLNLALDSIDCYEIAAAWIDDRIAEEGTP